MQGGGHSEGGPGLMGQSVGVLARDYHHHREQIFVVND